MSFSERFYHRISLYTQPLITGILLLFILLLTLWIRLQGADTLPDGQFTGNDAYLFHRQAHIIAEAGILPATDMDRWLPDGRDNGQLLTLYSYTIAYLHKILALLFPSISIYTLQLYLPPICFTIGISVLFLFLSHHYGQLFAFISCVLLATIPGSVERSAIGFGDRDAFCWLFGILVVITYLWKEQLPTGHRRTIATIASGSTVLLGGLSWSGFGIFLLIPMGVELWKFCTTDTEYKIHEYALWIAIFVPTLYLLSPVYQRGEGYTTHVAALMLLPPLVIFFIRATRYLLITYIPAFRKHAHKLAWGLTLLAIAAGAIYCYLQYGAFETTAFAFRESRFMKTMGELVDPDFIYWTDRYGAVFVLGSIGLILACSHFKNPNGTLLGGSLFLFTATTFYRRLIETWISTKTSDILFFIAVGSVAIALAIAAMRKTNQQDKTHHERILIAMIAWFILWVFLARSGKRYDFFIGLPLAFGTASILWIAPAFFNQQIKQNNKHKAIISATAFLILIAILLLPPLGGHLTRLHRANYKMRTPIPSEPYMIDALKWIKSELPPETVIAANWDDGMPLNVIGGVKTITDSDTFLPHWIHLYYRHVFCGQNETEVLEFLKTHHATHLMLTAAGVTARAADHAAIGSDHHGDRYFQLIPLRPIQTPIGADDRIGAPDTDTPFIYIDLQKDDTDTVTLTLTKTDKTTKMIEIKDAITPKMVDLQKGGLALYFDKDTHLIDAYYIPPIGWNSFAIKCFLQGKYSNAFEQIYPTNTSENRANVKIWKITYPPHIKTDQKYLLKAPTR